MTRISCGESDYRTGSTMETRRKMYCVLHASVNCAKNFSTFSPDLEQVK